MRVTVTIDSLDDTPALRRFIVAHRRVMATGGATHGVGPRVVVEGGDYWGVTTEPLSLDDALRVLAALDADWKVDDLVNDVQRLAA